MVSDFMSAIFHKLILEYEFCISVSLLTQQFSGWNNIQTKYERDGLWVMVLSSCGARVVSAFCLATSSCARASTMWANQRTKHKTSAWWHGSLLYKQNFQELGKMQCMCSTVTSHMSQASHSRADVQNQDDQIKQIIIQVYCSQHDVASG